MKLNKAFRLIWKNRLDFIAFCPLLVRLSIPKLWIFVSVPDSVRM